MSTIPVTADPKLVMLALAAEQGGIAAFPLTLVVGGSLISGILISSEAYRGRVVSGSIRLTRTEAEEVNIRQAIEHLFSEADKGDLPFAWLHLSDCVLIQNGQTVQLGGETALLRIQIAAVAGWMIGLPVPPAMRP